ncbi:MAG: glycoside hydrolase, partial [bacterium]
GKNWKNVTPHELTPWSKVSLMDASHFDTQTAYAAINRIRLDDLRPHIYRTHDGGKTWKEIVRGLPDDGPVNVVREDPQRKGLLFCGTEQAVFVSFDDGENWQPLRLNMPATSIRDLVIHDDDIVVGTHGRSFWILDDITPLRQIDAGVAASDAFLFKPQLAYRVRWNTNSDTPLPPEEPAGENPADGAFINYFLKTKPSTPVVLEIFDSAHRLVRSYSSGESPGPVNPDGLNIPTYWIRPAHVLSSEKGMQRFVWDLHYSPPSGFPPEYPMAAIEKDTPLHPLGPWVHPGDYTATMTVDGKSLTQQFTIKMDPRLSTSSGDLKLQFDLSMKAFNALNGSKGMLDEVRSVRMQIAKLPNPKIAAELDEKLGVLEGTTAVRRVRRASANASPGFRELSVQLRSLLDLFQEADVKPTSQAINAMEFAVKSYDSLQSQWLAIKSQNLKALNARLAKSGLKAISY